MTSHQIARESKAEIMSRRARQLMEFDLKLLPLWPADPEVPKSGKAPMTGKGVHDATNDFATFMRLVGSATDFNIGVATGSASDVIVIDVDPRNGGMKSLAELKTRLGRHCQGK
jgi:hypothetical protein